MADASPKPVRVASVQWMQKRIANFDEFAERLHYFAASAAAFQADFLVFPEIFTFQILSASPRRLAGQDAVEELTHVMPAYLGELQKLAKQFNLTIVGGSHIARTPSGGIRNSAYLVHPSGLYQRQDKIHATPNERGAWSVEGGSDVNVFDTPHGKVAILICYDIEFPELARRAIDAGAQIIFVPFCTDDRNGYLRVRYCAHARAIENQCYVVLSGSTGNLPNVESMDVHVGQSCVLTPCDFPFARDGVLVEAAEGTETVIVADLDLAKLAWAREQGSVKNLADRRLDLYGLDWKR